MTKEFIPYEQALALKELGFDEACLAIYTTYSTVNKRNYKNPVLKIVRQKSQFTQKGVTKAPLYQQAFRWFREKYGLYHVITIADLGKYESGNPDFQSAIYSKDPVVITIMNNYKTYEEAELECLKKLIEIVKEQNGKK